MLINSIFVNGWTLFAHPLFLEQLETLIRQVEILRQKDPTGYVKKNAAKRLAAISKLVFEVIPADPALPDYRQGNTLGDVHRHWFRAKFFQQHRLFFRYHAQARIIVFVWVNDDSSSDAYRVLKKMLDAGHPPDDWDSLLDEARSEDARFKGMMQS